MWNFWDTSFKDQIWKGEDLAFCNLATEAGFKIYANLDSWTTHHGSWGWKGPLFKGKSEWIDILSDSVVGLMKRQFNKMRLAITC
jgi:hypothetical protein